MQSISSSLEHRSSTNVHLIHKLECVSQFHGELLKAHFTEPHLQGPSFCRSVAGESGEEFAFLTNSQGMQVQLVLEVHFKKHSSVFGFYPTVVSSTCKFCNLRNRWIDLNLDNLLDTKDENQGRKLPSGLFHLSRRKSKRIWSIWGNIKLDLSLLNGLRFRICKSNKCLSPKFAFLHLVSSLQPD